jgi:hypothetical protein
MQKRTLVVGMTLVIVLFAAGLPGQAAPLFQGQSIIIYPTDGMTVSGQVEITGIAAHPNVLWYQVDYAPGSEARADSQWVTLKHADNTQVEGGVLATWDTAGLPDGQYTLALTLKGENDPLDYQYFVTHLMVNNAQPVETPTPEPPPTEEPVEAPTAVIGPTPTPVTVEQPATPTPRPSPTSQAAVEETITPSDEEDRPIVDLNVGVLRDAFFSGVLITAMLFLLWGLYLLLKASVRWFLRQRTRPPVR